MIFVVCGSGTFGYNCSSTYPCVNQPCNHTHGTCPVGGFQGGYKCNTCSTDMWYGWIVLIPTCLISTTY